MNNIESKIIDISTLDSDILTLSLSNDNVYKIILVNINKDFTVDVTLKEYTNAQISVLNENSNNNIKFVGNIEENAFLEIYFADFATGKFKVESDINLNGNYAKCVWHLGALSGNVDKKTFDISMYHNTSNTESLIDNYGVCKDGSKLVFSGICHVKQGAHKSKAHQNAKIMVFDEKSDAIAKPILKIDDNDIEASHAAGVGKISDDQLFYLTTRGISLATARQLITYGYLKPILNGFDNEDIRKHISEKIEGGF